MNDSQVESGFCQGPLWNLNLTWYTDTPDFPSCFHKTVLVYVPCCILWLLAGFEIRANLQSPKRFVRWSWVNISKLTFDILLFTFHVLKLSYAAWSVQNSIRVLPVDFVASAVFILTITLDFVLVLMAKRAGIINEFISVRCSNLPKVLIRSCGFW